MIHKKALSLFTIFHVLVVCFGSLVLVRLWLHLSEVPPPTTMANTPCNVARLVYRDAQGEHERCVPQVLHGEEENQSFLLKAPLFGVTRICAGNWEIAAGFASYELPPHMRPSVGTAVVTIGVRPHQCRFVSDSQLRQRQMAVTHITISPSYQGKGSPKHQPPMMKHVSCQHQRYSLLIKGNDGQKTFCFQGPGEASVAIGNVTSLLTMMPASVACSHFESANGTYAGIGIAIDGNDGANVLVADVLPGFEPSMPVCHIGQWPASQGET